MAFKRSSVRFRLAPPRFSRGCKGLAEAKLAPLTIKLPINQIELLPAGRAWRQGQLDVGRVFQRPAVSSSGLGETHQSMAILVPQGKGHAFQAFEKVQLFRNRQQLGAGIEAFL